MKRLLFSSLFCLLLHFVGAQEFQYTLQSVSGGNININIYGTMSTGPLTYCLWSNAIDVYLEQSGVLYHCGRFYSYVFVCDPPLYVTSTLFPVSYTGGGPTSGTCDGTTMQTATIPIPSACMPSGTYNIRLSVTEGDFPYNWPASTMGFITVGSTVQGVPPSAFNVTANIGTTTVTGSSSFNASATPTAVTCTTLGSISFNISTGVSPYTFGSTNAYGNTIPTTTTASSSYNCAGLVAGTYYVYAKDANGCRRDFVVTVNPPTPPTVTASKSPAQPSGGYCKNVCITLNATPSFGSGYSYQWKRNGVNVSTSQSFCNAPGSSPTTTTYSVTISSAYCTASGVVSALTNTSCVTRADECCTGPHREMRPGDSTEITTSIQVYPNPAAEVVNIQFADAVAAGTVLEFTDITGKTVRRVEVPEGAVCYTMNVNDLPAGLYLANVYEQETKIISTEFVVE